MKERFNKLNIYFRVTICSLILLVLFTIALTFLFFIGHLDIPLGLILGACINIVGYFALGLLEQKAKKNSKGIGNIIVTVSRFIILASTIVLVGWLSYEQNVQIFNIFSLVGGYLYPLIVLLILTVLQKKETSDVR
jgi:peptidoglycan biosynthesis protein MviN/MurJ (putative lipid II flippase)